MGRTSRFLEFLRVLIWGQGVLGFWKLIKNLSAVEYLYYFCEGLTRKNYLITLP